MYRLRLTEVLFALTFVLGAAASVDSALAQQKRGGTLIVGQSAHPPSLDDHMTNALAAKHATFNVYETVLTRGEDGRVITGLAESYSVSPDGLVYTIKLRPNVKFHNGKTLTSMDVRASLERYKRIAIRRDLLAPATSIEAPDAATVIVRSGT